MKESPKGLNIYMYEQLPSGLRDLNFGQGLHFDVFCVGTIIEGSVFVACNHKVWIRIKTLTKTLRC